MRMVESDDLDRWRTLDAAITLQALADHAKRDVTFEPIKNAGTSRWHATVSGRQFELLLTGPKYFDVKGKKGGGGAVDMAMYVLRLDFKQAVCRLRELFP